MNELIFFFYAFFIGGCTLGALRLGKEALIAFIALLGVLSNLFVIKQIMLFGFNVTASDTYTVGAMLSLQLLQEYYGRQATRYAIGISFLLLFFYSIAAIVHLTYVPSESDISHVHFLVILRHMPRIALASLTSYFVSQLLDYQLYGFLKRLCAGRYLLFRSYFSLIVVQLFDTIFFSFLGLYGIITHIKDVIAVSFAVKMAVIFITTPFVILSRKIVLRGK